MPDFPLNQLGLAVIPGITWMAFVVARTYAPRFLKLLKTPPAQWQGSDWLLFGILAGTALPALTNVPYWGLHFLSVFLGIDWLTEITWRLGQLANFFTRYGWYMVALPAHLVAAQLSAIRGVHRPRFYIGVSIAMTAAAYLILELVKPR